MRTRVVVVLGVAAITAAMLVAVARLTASDPDPDPASVPQHRAGSADAFVNSIGVVTHLDFLNTPYNNYDGLVKPTLAELGVKHARDQASQLNRSTVYSRYSDLCDTLGIKFILNVKEDLWPTPPTASDIDQIVAKAGCAVEGFEGPNEYNLDHSYPGWGVHLEAYQRSVFNAINASSHASLPLLAAPLGRESGKYPPGSEIPNLARESDANNMHSYTGANHPTGANPSGPPGDSLLFDSHIPMAEYVGASGRDLYSTETGYTTAESIQGVNEEAKERYILRLAFEYFNAGVEREYVYELIDTHNEEPTHPQSHFGLVAYDGTKKPSFRALENTIDVLEDPGPPHATGSLAYKLSGADANVHQTLLQKRDGTFYLVLWQEVRSYDKARDVLIDVPPQNVTVHLGQTVSSVHVFEPGSITSSGPADDAKTHPNRTLSAVSRLTEPIGDQVKIIQVEP